MGSDGFLVMGSSGEYDERSEWPVAVYLDKGLAQRHADLAIAGFSEARAKRTAALFEEPGGDAEAKNPFDERADLDCKDDGYYTVVPIAIRNEVPRAESEGQSSLEV